MNWLKDRKLIILVYACIVSLGGLITLFGIRVFAPKLLDIDVKWLIVAAIPIVLALIVGRYITRFKWMGLDIEIAAEDRIIDHEEVYHILQPFRAQTKSDLAVLNAMSAEDRGRPNVLEFELGKADYYEAGAIVAYVRQLPRIQFFLIRDHLGKFVALIFINRAYFVEQQFEFVHHFIDNLEQGRMPENLGYLVITKRILARTRIVDAYEALRKDRNAILPVFEDETSETPTGYTTLALAERYLAGLVVKMIKAKAHDGG